MKQIEQITWKKLSSLFSHRTSLTLLTFSTHLGILLNRKEHILKDINIQELVTEPSRRIEEYCFLIENTIKTIQFDVFQRGNENEIIEKIEEIKECIQDKIIHFVNESIGKKTHNENQIVFIDDLHVYDFIHVLFNHFYHISLNSFLDEVKKIQNTEHQILFCQSIQKFSSSFLSLEITIKMIECSECSQMVLTFFQ